MHANESTDICMCEGRLRGMSDMNNTTKGFLRGSTSAVTIVCGMCI